MNLNRVLLMGHLTRDPQQKYLPSQTAISEFGLAINCRFKSADGDQREEVTFVDCAAFGKTAENITKYFAKGKPIFVEGRLKFDQWEDKNGGGKRSKLSVVVDGFQFVGGKDDGAEDGESIGDSTRKRQPPPVGAKPQNQVEQALREDDIPFDLAR